MEKYFSPKKNTSVSCLKNIFSGIIAEVLFLGKYLSIFPYAHRHSRWLSGIMICVGNRSPPDISREKFYRNCSHNNTISITLYRYGTVPSIEPLYFITLQFGLLYDPSQQA